MVVFALSLAWAYATILQAPASGTYHDDGIYLVTARALAEGQGYRIISLPDAPTQTKYPILFPFLLSLVWRAVPSFPDNLLWLRAVPFIATLAWLYLSWRLLLRCGTTAAGAATIVALTAASPAVAYFGATLMAETLFAALLSGSLLILTMARDAAPRAWRLCALAGLLAGASLLTRTAGVAVVVAAFAWLVARRRWKDAAAFGAAAATLMLPWVWWVATQTQAADPYHSASVYGSQGSWNIVFSYTWREKVGVLWMNSLYAASTPASFWGQRQWLLIPSLLASGVVMRGLWVTRAHPVTWCVIVYLGMVLIWVWPPTRLLLPVVPLLLWQMSVALRQVPNAIVAAMAMVLTISSSVAVFQLAAEAPARVISWPRQRMAEDPQGWPRLSAMYAWIRRETPVDAVLIGNLDPTYFLYTGRKAVRAFVPDAYALYYSTGATKRLETVGEFRNQILEARADFWVWSEGASGVPTHSRLLDEVSREYPGSLSATAGDAKSGYAVYRINRSSLMARDRIRDYGRR
jgi:hypothetical protein